MTNLVYTIDETALLWDDSTNADKTFTIASLGAAAGRQGELYDLGISARATLFKWRAFVRFATEPIEDELISIYLKTSDGTYPDNDDGTDDIAVSEITKLNNLTPIGVIKVDEVTTPATTVVYVAKGVVEILDRWVAPVFWNGTADGLHATANVSGFILTPVADQIQNTV